MKFTFDSYPEWLFIGDTCIDLGIANVRADLVKVDDPNIVDSLEAACNQAQLSFLKLPEGMYNVALTPLDEAGGSLVTAPIIGQIAAGKPGADTELTINVPHDAWTKRDTFTGTFLFRIAWGGQSCELAVPAIATQTLEMRHNGQVIANKETDSGQRLDGTDPAPCRPLSEPFAQFAKTMPFGPVSFHVVGKDAEGMVRFDRRFDTFVGVGENNPTINFDMPLPDAAVDAPIDSIDAPLIDALPDA